MIKLLELTGALKNNVPVPSIITPITIMLLSIGLVSLTTLRTNKRSVNIHDWKLSYRLFLKIVLNSKHKVPKNTSATKRTINVTNTAVCVEPSTSTVLLLAGTPSVKDHNTRI